MNAVILDDNTYRDVEQYARENNVGVADVVKESLYYFFKKFKPASDIVSESQIVLPEHLKKMRGILSGVEDRNDDRLNYLLNK